MYALIVVVVVIIHDEVLKLYTRLCKVVNFSETYAFCFCFKEISSKIFTLKLRHQGAICWSRKELFWPYGLHHIFLEIKPFFVFKIESWNFQHLFHSILWNFAKFELTFISIFSMGSLKVSQNPKSNRCWKFQLSVLKNKKSYS